MAPFKRYEQLSKLVKMYPCSYIKQEKNFKKEEVKQTAWKEVAKELDLEYCKLVEQLWNNLKKNAFQTKYKTSACHLFVFTIEFFLLGLVVISVWWE